MNETVKLAFVQLREARETIEAIRAEIPALSEAEKLEEAAKKVIQEWAKTSGEEGSAEGYEVKLSVRGSWDGKKLDGYAAANPEILQFKSETTVATVKKAK